jgi:hypothetical protein
VKEIEELKDHGPNPFTNGSSLCNCSTIDLRLDN